MSAVKPEPAQYDSPQDGVHWNPFEQNWNLRAPWRSDLAPSDGSSAACPFCPGGPEAPLVEGPHVVSSKHPFIASPADGSYDAHRVLFFSRHHDRNLDALSDHEILTVLNRIREESELLLRHDDVQSVYVFQASGPLFGGSVSHPHLQIIGFPFVPSKLVPAGAQGCPLCTGLIDPCLQVSGTADALLAVPPWSRMPYEMVIAPRRHAARFEDCDPAQIATLLSLGLRKLPSLVKDGPTPYTLNIMQEPKLPRGNGRNLEHHFRIEIFPYCTEAGRIRQVFALEAGAGVILNAVQPNTAAEQLRTITHYPRSAPD